MRKIMISPSKYIQGQDELINLGALVLEFSGKALLVASKDDQARVQAHLDRAIEKNPFEIVYGQFGEECTKREINRMVKLAEDNNCGVIIGLGGGKALDTAKGTSSVGKKPVIIVPTIAATDAPHQQARHYL